LQHRILASQNQLPHAHHHDPSWATGSSATSTATNPPEKGKTLIRTTGYLILFLFPADPVLLRG
jgi:hypothetical protein